MHTFIHRLRPVIAAASLLTATISWGAIESHDLTIRGSDAIFLAGRTDVVIPAASDAWTTGSHLIRHPGPTPEEIQETMPSFINVAAGDVIRVLDPASGGINFFNGFGPPFFGPAGNTTGGSDLTSLDGISGYKGPQGALAGVFLNDDIPNGAVAPGTLDFTGALADAGSLTPLLGQVFYIGSGVTSAAAFKQFIAPTGATRLFFAIPDGFGFGGAPGAYDDNDGAYRIVVGINQLPVPEADTYAMLALGLGALVMVARRRRTL